MDDGTIDEGDMVDAVLDDVDPSLWGSPDPLELVCEVADMMAVFAADRLVRVDALHREALADAARHGRELTDVVERGIRLELAAGLRISEYAADRLLSQADALVRRYPRVLEALAGARITERHADLLAEALDGFPPEESALRDIVLEKGLALAESQPVGQFRRAVRVLVDRLRAVTLDRRHEEALSRRRVVLEPADDGLAWLMTLMPAVEARASFDRATRAAKILIARDGDDRTLDQARADVIGDLLVDGEVAAHPADARGIRATVVVTVPALSLLGVGGVGEGDGGGGEVDEGDSRAGAGAATVRAAGMAEVEGVGPIPLGRARELCGGAKDWMRVLTHPETGMVLSVGRDLYRPPESLRRLVRWRSDRCMAPGCGVPAARCELDHTVAWEHGGVTSTANLAPICKGHHLVKHHGGWSVSQDRGGGGALVWVSPLGRRYVSGPERRMPEFTPQNSPPAPF
ncbi:DUF222 domain-containing protein [Microbacterium sp. CJ88]|uniref:HNH endonuclease signature motif containing protein n=1 Tax=Microbacterium sp. CJ88 TaxID=3445672 RepID=UPI003F65CC25